MRRRRILVVDDEKNMRTTLADILRVEGYDVDLADRGEKAVKLCSREGFDVVLMDVRMPGMDGMEAFLRIKRSRPTARVILMSAYAMERLERVALDEGALAFLRKPFRVEELLRLIRSVEEG